MTARLGCLPQAISQAFPVAPQPVMYVLGNMQQCYPGVVNPVAPTPVYLVPQTSAEQASPAPPAYPCAPVVQVPVAQSVPVSAACAAPDQPKQHPPKLVDGAGAQQQRPQPQQQQSPQPQQQQSPQPQQQQSPQREQPQRSTPQSRMMRMQDRLHEADCIAMQNPRTRKMLRYLLAREQQTEMRKKAGDSVPPSGSMQLPESQPSDAQLPESQPSDARLLPLCDTDGESQSLSAESTLSREKDANPLELQRDFWNNLLRDDADAELFSVQNMR
eukprot:TRINITY_DN2453_c0_g3_i2.p1 TRINITY_DN2453_c0_g3~~TRINITY_DN2453_c0_g3_i2.p1  ORF type:complete len:273 (+),score=35.29 TRINITY_DN2453_c0_g3_i2:80-898(+)